MSKIEFIKEDQAAYAIDGVQLATASSGIRYQGRDDLLLFALQATTQTAAIFTTNAFCAAPVIVAKSHLQQAKPKFLIINAGNANAGTGQVGIDDALTVCKTLAELTNCKSVEVLPFSTGVIAERLNVNRIIDVLPNLINSLATDKWLDAAKAIMTTDTSPKVVSCKLLVGDKPVHITGVCKGSGMIKPNMATMLAYIATDAVISESLLQSMLKQAVEQSFNRITVDGDTSTNDACVLMASGCAENDEICDKDSIGYDIFQSALSELFVRLAQSIVRDGEGATRFVTLIVSEGKSSQECLEFAYTVAHSPLVKTALFAGDPNWGRILAAIGRTNVDDLDISKISIAIDDLQLLINGEPNPEYSEDQAKAIMQKTDITLSIVLARGSCSETIWTTDLSYDYIKINAEYRS